MDTSLDAVLRAALSLSDEDQLRHLAALRTSAEERGLPPFDEAWMKEIERRSDAYDAGETSAATWSEVEERVQRRVSGCG